MIAAIDTCSLVAFLGGEHGRDVEVLDLMLEEGSAVVPPIVLTEILSDPDLPHSIRTLLSQLPLMRHTEGFYERAGALRQKLLKRKI